MDESPIYYVKETIHKGYRLYDSIFMTILGKVKLEKHKTDQWLPGTGVGRGAGYKRVQGIF